MLSKVIYIENFDLESLSLFKMILYGEVADEFWVKAIADDFSLANLCPLITEKMSKLSDKDKALTPFVDRAHT